MKDKRIANFEKLTTGEMCFSSDITPGNDYLYVYPVVSNVPSGKLLSIDFSEAERVEGFIYGYTAKDIPGKNAIGAISREEEPLLAFDTLNYVGQPVAINNEKQFLWCAHVCFGWRCPTGAREFTKCYQREF